MSTGRWIWVTVVAFWATAIIVRTLLAEPPDGSGAYVAGYYVAAVLALAALVWAVRQVLRARSGPDGSGS